jgi:hypothetical protein
MHQVEASGIATELLAGPTRSVSVADSGRVLLRAAAWSMLAEPDAHRPYGWSHCLTMPQAVLAGNAATHHDQHLVKYTLACLDAAAWDRTFARLYLAAAASLAGYWSARSGGAADRA